MIKSKPKTRDWRDAAAKIQQEGRCRVCGATDFLEIAHVTGRKHDAPIEGLPGSKRYYVHPDSVIPLCGAFSEKNCHALYDRRCLDLLPFLFWPEQTRAVEDAGGIINALRRVSPGGGTW